MDGVTVVVFTDGSCSALDTIVNNVSSPSNYTWTGPITQGLKIVKVDTVSEESGDAFLTLVVEDKEEERSVYYYKVPNAEEEAIMAPQVGVVHLKRDHVKLINSCVVLGNSGLVVLSICELTRPQFFLFESYKNFVFPSRVRQANDAPGDP